MRTRGEWTSVERVVELDAPADRLEPRLIEWAKASEFACTMRGPPLWVYGRFGWRTWFGQDMEKNLPSHIEVEVLATHPLTVRTLMQVDCRRCGTTAADDESGVSQRFGLMLAYLRGVYDF